MTKLVILDRDGVINVNSKHYIRSPDEWSPIPGALEAIACLTRAGWNIVVATNQAGIAKRVFSEDMLGLIHSKMLTAVRAVGGEIQRVIYCPHHPGDLCACRKPYPGMLLAACESFGAQPSEVAFIGDSLRDLQAAEAAGCQPVLVLSGNGCETLSHGGLPSGVRVFEDLMHFALELTLELKRKENEDNIPYKE